MSRIANLYHVVVSHRDPRKIDELSLIRLIQPFRPFVGGDWANFGDGFLAGIATLAPGFEDSAT